MARTTVNPDVVPTGLPLTEEALAWVPVDVANGNRFAHTGREILIVQNSDGADPYDITFQSAPINGRQDPLDNVAIELAAGDISVFNFRGEGWRQPSGDDAGYVQFDGENAAVEVIVLRLPA